MKPPLTILLLLLPLAVFGQETNLDNKTAAASIMHEDHGRLAIGNALERTDIIIASVTHTPDGKSRAEMRLGEIVKGATVEFSFDLAIDESFSQRTGIVMQTIGPPFNQPSFALRVKDGRFHLSHGPDEKTLPLTDARPGVWQNWRFVIRNFGPDASFEVFLDGKSILTGSGNTDNGQKKSILRLGPYIGRDRKGDATAYLDQIRVASGIISPLNPGSKP